jgi:hypothetical protein
MVNYQNGKIYRIVCNKTGLQYIGSTVSSLSVRLGQHKHTIKCTSQKVLENGDYNIVLVEDYPVDRKEQLLQRERFYIETMDCVNKKYPLRTQHEWYEDNKERLIEKQTTWNNNNREKCFEYKKKYTNKNKGIYIDLHNIIEDMDIDDNIEINYDEIYSDDEKIDLIDKIINK